jgi:hypothetical protein
MRHTVTRDSLLKIASTAFVFSAIGFAQHFPETWQQGSVNYLVDGHLIPDSNHPMLQLPEGVQELKWQITPYDIVVSPTGGLASDTVPGSGGNELHGSAVGRTRQTDWLANYFFANKAGQPVPNQPFYNWTFSLGSLPRHPATGTARPPPSCGTQSTTDHGLPARRPRRSRSTFRPQPEHTSLSDLRRTHSFSVLACSLISLRKSGSGASAPRPVPK